MHLHSVTGDIVDLAPEICEMTVLWLRKGFNRNSQTWRDVRRRHPMITVQEPWQNPVGVTFDVTQPGQLLHRILVLPNPEDAFGYPAPATVGAVVAKAMDEALRVRARMVGFIHIPVSFGGRCPTKADDVLSAGAMIGALGAWNALHPDEVYDVFLFDLGGDFESLLVGGQTPLAE
jgi:hypothetical protein